jgi:hypothetical protein
MQGNGDRANQARQFALTNIFGLQIQGFGFPVDKSPSHRESNIAISSSFLPGFSQPPMRHFVE